MISGIVRRFPMGSATALITVLACALYGPFLRNPRVFDDWVFFSGESFAYYATHPFGLGMRLPPYFTMALTEIEIGTMLAPRLVSLAFHIAVAFALCRLIYELLRAVLPSGQEEKAAEPNAALWAGA